MSRILRRPMFRGGPVDSYGTGIATGLGTRSQYRNGGVSYNPYNKTQTQSLVEAYTPKGLPQSFIDFFKANQANQRPTGRFRTTTPGATLEDAEGLLASNTMMNDGSGGSGISYPGSDYGDPISDEDIEKSLSFGEYMPGKKDIQRIKYDLYGSGRFDDDDELRELKGDTETFYADADPYTAPGLEAIRQQNIDKMDSSPKKVKTPKVDETTDETEVTMTDLEKALGLDKAKRRDLGDMLGRASAAFLGAGDVREGLAEFMAAEAKSGPSRTERIKSIAGLEEFKAKKAQELYDKKTAALLKQKEGTKGAFQKKLETITDQKENTPGHKIALAELKLEPTIQGQIQSDTIDNNYTKPSPAVIIGYMDLYYPQSYKGTVSATDEMTGKEAGTYITEDATQIIFWDGTDARTQSI